MSRGEFIAVIAKNVKYLTISNSFHLFHLKIFKIQTSQRYYQHQPVFPNVIILTSNSIRNHFLLNKNLSTNCI
jgi:hypothetical protein